MRYPELQYDGLNELEEVWMLSDGFLIAEAEIVALRMIIRGLTLVFEHIPGFRREGSINPGLIRLELECYNITKWFNKGCIECI